MITKVEHGAAIAHFWVYPLQMVVPDWAMFELETLEELWNMLAPGLVIHTKTEATIGCNSKALRGRKSHMSGLKQRKLVFAGRRLLAGSGVARRIAVELLCSGGNCAA